MNPSLIGLFIREAKWNLWPAYGVIFLNPTALCGFNVFDNNVNTKLCISKLMND